MTETFHEVSVTRSRRVRRCTWCARKIEQGEAYKIGDIVSLKKWDVTEPPWKAFGEGRITALKECRSQSGVVATIESASRRVMTGMDIAWLTHVETAE